MNLQTTMSKLSFVIKKMLFDKGECPFLLNVFTTIQQPPLHVDKDLSSALPCSGKILIMEIIKPKHKTST